MSDYRNGVRWFHFDPTKWFVWSMGRLGLAGSLRRLAKHVIESARRAVVAEGLVPATVATSGIGERWRGIDVFFSPRDRLNSGHRKAWQWAMIGTALDLAI